MEERKKQKRKLPTSKSSKQKTKKKNDNKKENESLELESMLSSLDSISNKHSNDDNDEFEFNNNMELDINNNNNNNNNNVDIIIDNDNEYDNKSKNIKNDEIKEKVKDDDDKEKMHYKDEDKDPSLDNEEEEKEKSYKILLYQKMFKYKVNWNNVFFEQFFIPLILSYNQFKSSIPKFLTCYHSDKHVIDYISSSSSSSSSLSSSSQYLILNNEEKLRLIDFDSPLLLQDLENNLFGEKNHDCIFVVIDDYLPPPLPFPPPLPPFHRSSNVKSINNLLLHLVKKNSINNNIIIEEENISVSKINFKWALKSSYFGANDGFTLIILREFWMLNLIKNKSNDNSNNDNKYSDLLFHFHQNWKISCSLFIEYIINVTNKIKYIHSFLETVFNVTDELFKKLIVLEYGKSINEIESLCVLPSIPLIDEQDFVYTSFQQVNRFTSLLWLYKRKDSRLEMNIKTTRNNVETTTKKKTSSSEIDVDIYTKISKRKSIDLLHFLNLSDVKEEEERPTVNYEIKFVIVSLEDIKKKPNQIWFNEIISEFTHYEQWNFKLNKEVIGMMNYNVKNTNRGYLPDISCYYHHSSKLSSVDNDNNNNNNNNNNNESGVEIYPNNYNYNTSSCFYIDVDSNIWKFSPDQSRLIIYLSYVDYNGVFKQEFATKRSVEEVINYFKIFKLKRRSLNFYTNLKYEEITPEMKKRKENKKTAIIHVNPRFILWNTDELSLDLFCDISDISKNIKLIKNITSFLGNFILYKETSKETKDNFMNYFMSQKILKTYTYINPIPKMLYQIKVNNNNNKNNNNNDDNLDIDKDNNDYNEKNFKEIFKKSSLINFSFTNNVINERSYQKGIKYHKIISSPFSYIANSPTSSSFKLSSSGSLVKENATSPLITTTTEVNRKQDLLKICEDEDSFSHVSPHFKIDYFYLVFLYNQMKSNINNMHITEEFVLRKKVLDLAHFTKYLNVKSLINFLNFMVQIYIPYSEYSCPIWFDTLKPFSQIIFQIKDKVISFDLSSKKTDNNPTNPSTNTNINTNSYSFYSFKPKLSTTNKLNKEDFNFDELNNLHKHVFYNQYFSSLTIKKNHHQTPTVFNLILLLTWLSLKEINDYTDDWEENYSSVILNKKNEDNNSLFYAFKTSNEVYKDELIKLMGLNGETCLYITQKLTIVLYSMEKNNLSKKIKLNLVTHNHQKDDYNNVNKNNYDNNNNSSSSSKDSMRKERKKITKTLDTYLSYINKIGIHDILFSSSSSSSSVINKYNNDNDDDNICDNVITVDEFREFLTFLNLVKMKSACEKSSLYNENFITLIQPNIPKSLEDLILTHEYKEIGLCDKRTTTILIYSKELIDISTLQIPSSSKPIFLSNNQNQPHKKSNLIYIDKFKTNVFLLTLIYDSSKNIFQKFSLILWLNLKTINTTTTISQSNKKTMYSKLDFELTKEKFNYLLSKAFIYVVLNNF